MHHEMKNQPNNQTNKQTYKRTNKEKILKPFQFGAAKRTQKKCSYCCFMSDAVIRESAREMQKREIC